MKKYILLSIMLLAGGMNLVGMKRAYEKDRYEEDKAIRIDLTKDDEQTKTCDVCLEDKPMHDFITPLSCCAYDASCTDCLLGLINASLEEKTTADIKCPNRDCAQPIIAQDIHAITHTYPEIYEQFCKVATDEYLTKEKYTKHCPTPDCTFSFINDAEVSRAFRCPQCKRISCTKCLVRHAPEMTCEQAHEFFLKITSSGDQEKSATEEWLQKNTKQCPQCKASVEKNGGCYTMKCTKCNHQFCWICLNPHDHTMNHPCGLWENAEQMNQANQRLINQLAQQNQPAINNPQQQIDQQLLQGFRYEQIHHEAQQQLHDLQQQQQPMLPNHPNANVNQVNHNGNDQQQHQHVIPNLQQLLQLDQQRALLELQRQIQEEQRVRQLHQQIAQVQEQQQRERQLQLQQQLQLPQQPPQGPQLQPRNRRQDRNVNQVNHNGNNPPQEQAQQWIQPQPLQQAQPFQRQFQQQGLQQRLEQLGPQQQQQLLQQLQALPQVQQFLQGQAQPQVGQQQLQLPQQPPQGPQLQPRNRRRDRNVNQVNHNGNNPPQQQPRKK